MVQVLGTGKALQEKLSYYLDLIEMQIAYQISQKSDSFFQAVASHDAVREELGKALTAVKALRLKVNEVDSTVVQGSLKGLYARNMPSFVKLLTLNSCTFQFCNAKLLDRITPWYTVNSNSWQLYIKHSLRYSFSFLPRILLELWISLVPRKR